LPNEPEPLATATNIEAVSGVQEESSMSHIQLPTNVVPIHYDIDIRPNSTTPTFDGSVRITVEVREPTSKITLNSLDLKFDSALLGQGGNTARVTFDDKQQTATLHFDKPIAKGEYQIQIDYAGKVYDKAQGLFISNYGTPEAPKRMLLTQFEAASARRFVPCWDEPARKATFSMSVAISKEEVAVSNMPIESVSALEKDLQCIRFQKSPKMSSYLLFLGIGDFERLEADAGTTKIAVVARKGSAQKGKFALESAVSLLAYFNDYFGTPYPLPKLDLIAAPGGGGFSAMENWGAILYFENALLVDPLLSSESDRQRVFVVVAHEMAHQWFGNLVTMEWWDNLWLNEGFASWMENKATHRFHPEWMMWLQSETDRQRAMRQDSKRTTHPVVQPVPSGDVAEQSFDDITYRKGQSVIRMLESYIGEEKFRNGVRSYMKRYAYQNTVTDNLWDELEAAGAKQIKQIADDFTLQPGVPMVTVEAETAGPDDVRLNLRQGRFAVDDGPHDPFLWHIPILAAPAGAATPSAAQLFEGRETISFSIKGKLPIKINYGQTAYYRTQYSKEVFESLTLQFGSLPAADQLGLLYDAWALGEVGKAPITGYLELISKTPIGADPSIWRQIIETLISVDALYAGLAQRENLRAFARKILQPIFGSVGWVPAAGEADIVAVLRESLLNALGRLDDPSVKSEARRRFDLFVANPTDPQGLPAAIRTPTLRVVALWADRAVYDTIHRLANGATDPLEKQQLFVALAAAKDAGLAAETLRIALGNEPAATTGPSMIARVAVDNADLAWRFALDHLQAVTDKLDPLQRDSFVPSLGAQSTDPRRLPELRSFIDNKVPEGARKQVERYFADLSFRLQVKAQRLPEIDEWLAAHG
jgi:aminopeptidase N